MTFSFSGGAGWFTDDPGHYGFVGNSQGSLSGESPERLELPYGGEFHRMLIGDWTGAYQIAEVLDISPEGWGGVEGSTSLIIQLSVSVDIQGLAIRQVVQADTGMYKYELFSTNIIGADVETDLTDSTFTFSKTAERHSLRIIKEGTTLTLEVDGELEATIDTTNSMARVIMITTDHSSANTIRYGKVAVGSGDSVSDRMSLNVVTELAPWSTGVHHTEGVSVNFDDVNDWTSGGALDESNLDYIAGDDFSTKHQSYGVPNYTPVGDKQAMLVITWQGVDHATKLAVGYSEISDGTNESEGTGHSISHTNGSVIGVFDKDPGDAVWDGTAFGLLEIGWRADQGADAVNCECFAVQGEIYDFNADPPPTIAPQVHHQRHHNLAL